MLVSFQLEELSNGKYSLSALYARQRPDGKTPRILKQICHVFALSNDIIYEISLTTRCAATERGIKQ